MVNEKYYVEEETIKEFKLIAAKHSKELTERRLLESMEREEGQSLSCLLVFHFLLLNWSSVRQIRESGLLLEKKKKDSKRGEKKLYPDLRELKSGGTVG